MVRVIDTLAAIGVWLISAGIGIVLGSVIFGVIGGIAGFMLWPAFFYTFIRIKDFLSRETDTTPTISTVKES